MRDDDVGTVDASRRRWIASLAALGAIVALPPAWLRAAEAATMAELSVAPVARGRKIPPHLVGLSYETRHLIDTGLFSPRNADLAAYFRTLNPHGILRIGGNTSDFAVWSEYRGELPPEEGPGDTLPKRRFPLTPAQIKNLAGFARASGWRVIFGVNLKIDRPDMAAQLAVAVQRELGDALLAIQIGNEPNSYRDAAGNHYTFAEYLSQWRRSERAIRAALPEVAIVGPDTSANTDWVLHFADEASPITGLSRHYYRGGAEDPTSSIADLLSGDAPFLADVARIAAAADRRGLPFYLTEVNSYYDGGRLGVSNTLASALWGGDFVLGCAQAGAGSVQFHGGPLGALEISLDRVRHPALGEGGYKSRLDGISGRYTPIAGDAGVGFYARPLYYGMMLARQFAGARFIETTLHARGANLTAYAADQAAQRVIAVFNKDLSRDVSLRIAFGRPVESASLWRLTAPAIDDVHDTTLAGGQVDAHGTWTPRRVERLSVDDGIVGVRVPRGSGLLIFAKQSSKRFHPCGAP